MIAEVLSALLIKYHATRVHERYWGESDADRHARIARIAAANVRACQDVKLPGRWTFAGCLALLTTTEEWESGLERAVHSGERRGPAGELCLVQLHHNVTRPGAIRDIDYQISEEEWASLGGLDEAATYRCAFAGAKVLMSHAARCVPFAGDSWWSAAQIFAEYHHPSNTCAAVVSTMSSHRGMTYSLLYRKLLMATGGG